MKTFQYIKPEFVAPIDLQTLNTAYSNLESMHQEAVKTSSELKNAIGQLQLNESEEPFRQQLVRSVEDTINSNMQYGNLASAYDDIVKLSGDIVSNPALIGRLKAQQEYLKYMQQIETSDIPEQYKENFKILNPYHYEDKYDDKGNIVGGSKWEPNTLPVKSADYNKVMTTALQYITPTQGKSAIPRFLKEDGTYTNKLEPGVKAVWVDTITSEVTEITEAELKKALESAIKADPNVLASLQQDWKMAKMDYDKGANPLYKIHNGTTTLTFNQFVDNIFNPMVKAKAQRNVNSVVDYNNNFYKDYASVFGVGDDTTGSRNIVISTPEGPLVAVKDFSGVQAINNTYNANNILRDRYKKATGKELPSNITVKNRDAYIKHLGLNDLSEEEINAHPLVVEYDKIRILSAESAYNEEIMRDNNINEKAIAAVDILAAIERGDTFDPDSPDYVEPSNKYDVLERNRLAGLINDMFPNNSNSVFIEIYQTDAFKAFKDHIVANNPKLWNELAGNIEDLKKGKRIFFSKENATENMFSFFKAVSLANDETNMFQRDVKIGWVDSDTNERKPYLHKATTYVPDINAPRDMPITSREMTNRINSYHRGLVEESQKANLGGGEDTYLQSYVVSGANISDIQAGWELQGINPGDPDDMKRLSGLGSFNDRMNTRVLYQLMSATPESCRVQTVEDGILSPIPASENRKIKDEIFEDGADASISYIMDWTKSKYVPQISYKTKGGVKNVAFEFGKNSDIEEILNSNPTLNVQRDILLSKHNGRALRLGSIGKESDMDVYAIPDQLGNFNIKIAGIPDTYSVIEESDEAAYEIFVNMKTAIETMHYCLDKNIEPSEKEGTQLFTDYATGLSVLLGLNLNNPIDVQTIKDSFERESGIQINIQ